MKARLLTTFIILMLVVLAITAPTVTYASSSKTRIKGVTYEFDVEKITKIVDKSTGKKYGAILFNLKITFKIANYTDTELVVPIGISFVSSKKYNKAVDAELVSCSVIYKGENIVSSAKFVTSQLSRVEITLSKPINGTDWATVEIVVKGMVKSTSKLYVTSEYKYYKDYKPINGKILYVPITNYYYGITWETDKVDGEKVPGIRVIVKAPEGWKIMYARSSLSSKLRYMDIHSIEEKDGRHVVEFWYLSSKTVKPTKFKPASTFEIEVGFTPETKTEDPVVKGIMIALLLLALFFAWFYRDVWKYTTRKVM
ncbi:hypothetical protein J4526_01730 [Desulfurococcaceae archaeon MEX13E-LK6-19]|nr:hypothetical protein J4526_01730 [Desulfurococcaceae archaeon MEX13E-LK6-19]